MGACAAHVTTMQRHGDAAKNSPRVGAGAAHTVRHGPGPDAASSGHAASSRHLSLTAAPVVHDPSRTTHHDRVRVLRCQPFLPNHVPRQRA